MGILEKLKTIEISFTLDDALIVLMMLVLFVILIKIIYKLIKSKIKIKTVAIGGISVELECNNDVKSLANDVWVELSTRKIALPFDEENDVIVEVYNSWYTVFEKFREILKKIPMSKNKNVDTLANIILRGFNEELREHLTKWQARFRKWYKENENESGDPQEIQKKYPQYEELISDLKKVNYKMIALTEELNKIRNGE